MNIGLPRIRALPDCPDPTGLYVPASVDNVHNVRLSESLTIQVITSDEIGLETGGSVWHAGFRALSFAKFVLNPLLLMKYLTNVHLTFFVSGFALASHLVANPHLVHGKIMVLTSIRVVLSLFNSF